MSNTYLADAENRLTPLQDNKLDSRPSSLSSDSEPKVEIAAVDKGTSQQIVPSTDGASTSAAATTEQVAPAVSPTSARPNLFTRSFAALARHGLLLGGCAASLVVGCGIGYWALGHSASADDGATSGLSADSAIKIAGAGETDAASASSSVHYVATATRRNEPIKPLVPFDDLDPEAIELGRRLFHEQALSGNGRMACVSCHALTQGGTSRDALPRGVNGQAAKFNAPSVLNAGLNLAFSWDGRFATLEEQLDDPITRPEELGASWERILKFLNSDASYRAQFQATFDSEPTREAVATALATFERSLITPNSQFDQWLAGNENALNGDEFGGYFLFKKYGCVNCHQGAAVGGTMFQPLGLAKAYFNSSTNPIDLGRFQVTQRERDRHVFRVPALRNVALTAPYLHDGRAPTLEAAIAVMLEFQCGEAVNAEDVRRLTAFLKTLSGSLPVAP
jgi:cytochrome c peroxidase